MISSILKGIDKLINRKEEEISSSQSALEEARAMYERKRVPDVSVKYLEGVPDLGKDHEYLVEHVKEVFPVSTDHPSQDYNRHAWLMAVHHLRTASTCGWQMDMKLTDWEIKAAREQAEKTDNPVSRVLRDRSSNRNLNDGLVEGLRRGQDRQRSDLVLA